MERKIGEIFEYNGEWYQCVVGNNCENCAFKKRKCYLKGGTDDPIGECCYDRRRDNKAVIYKRLEKIGEPHEYFMQGTGIILVQEYILASQSYICGDEVIDCQKDGRVAIKIKQNKEDMEEKKSAMDFVVTPPRLTSDKPEHQLNLKPFDIQKAREGKPVCTRDGRSVRILCFDANIMPGNKNILALIRKDDSSEYVEYYTSNGKFSDSKDDINDLMMPPERKNGWINIYRGQVYNTFEKAEEARKIAEHGGDNYLKTIKIDWEE